MKRKKYILDLALGIDKIQESLGWINCNLDGRKLRCGD